MNLQTKLDMLHMEIVSALCGIQEFSEKLLPHIVYVEEETELSLDCGNSIYNAYNLIKIFPDGTCILENPGTGKEEKRQLNEINIDSLATIWNYYRDLSGIQEENSVTQLQESMELIATSLITSRHITDFTVHDVNFIHRTNAEIPFVWLVYDSGTHIYATNEAQDIRNFKDLLDHFENYFKKDFCLYRYDGIKLFPVFPGVIREWIKKELTKN